jgi:hypothetical protein
MIRYRYVGSWCLQSHGTAGVSHALQRSYKSNLYLITKGVRSNPVAQPVWSRTNCSVHHKHMSTWAKECASFRCAVAVEDPGKYEIHVAIDEAVSALLHGSILSVNTVWDQWRGMMSKGFELIDHSPLIDVLTQVYYKKFPSPPFICSHCIG